MQKNFGYLFSSPDDFNKAGRATEEYTHENKTYKIQEERVGDFKEPDATILRVLDENQDVKVAATYMNGLENRTTDEYDGFTDPLNHLEFDNPLHAVNEISGGQLNSQRDYSQNTIDEEFISEDIEVQ